VICWHSLWLCERPFKTGLRHSSSRLECRRPPRPDFRRLSPRVAAERSKRTLDAARAASVMAMTASVPDELNEPTLRSQLRRSKAARWRSIVPCVGRPGSSPPWPPGPGHDLTSTNDRFQAVRIMAPLRDSHSRHLPIPRHLMRRPEAACTRSSVSIAGSARIGAAVEGELSVGARSSRGEFLDACSVHRGLQRGSGHPATGQAARASNRRRSQGRL